MGTGQGIFFDTIVHKIWFYLLQAFLNLQACNIFARFISSIELGETKQWLIFADDE